MLYYKWAVTYQQFKPFTKIRRTGRKSTIGKRVRKTFFTQDPDDDTIWRCICGTARKQAGSGYANLISHAQSKHADQFSQLNEEE